MPPPKRVKMGAFYRVLRLMELAAEFGYTTQRASSVEKPWQGGEDRRDGRAAHHEEFEALGAFLLPCWATGMTLLAVRCRSGAPPRGQPWTPAVTLLHGCDGLNARRERNGPSRPLLADVLVRKIPRVSGQVKQPAERAEPGRVVPVQIWIRRRVRG